ncbi:MAG TPA: MFS transporter [Burkholderiales bacterium]|nr:MFS transporter [Burkholderiales bacterium]
MSPLELRATLSLASIFALRMLGLFLILPVFAVYASHLKGGGNHTLVGLALGAYGLTQGMLQIPYGMASDRYGRKRIIVIGLALFALGSFVAAIGGSIHLIIVGRAMQGAGAISAPVMAFLADMTREQHRTKAMALVGSSIGMMFALSMVGSPLLYRYIGMGGIFILTGVLALIAIWVVIGVVPKESAGHHHAEDHAEGTRFADVLRNKELLRLDLGIFSLHSVQMAIFVVVPLAMVSAGGIPVDEHWKIYLPVVLGSFALMIPAIIYAEKKDAMKPVFLAAIGLMAVVQLGFAFSLHNFPALVVLLLGFFVAFNILEASLPSLVSRMAPVKAKGAALGVYNTMQSLGLFFGGAAGGWLMQNHGRTPVFIFGGTLICLWGIAAASMRVPKRVQRRGGADLGDGALGDGVAR